MTALQVLPAIVLWIMVTTRFIGLWFGWRTNILPALVIIALAVTLNIDPIYLAVDHGLGNWNLLNVIVHLLMGAAMTELSRLLLHVMERSSRHIKVLISVGVILAVVQIFLLAISDTEGSAANFTDTFAGTPSIALYQVSFFAWFGIITGYTGVATLRRDRCGESRSFRTGFDVLSAGCALGVLAALSKISLIGMTFTGRDTTFHHSVNVFYHVLIAVMILAFAFAFLYPSAARIKAGITARKETREALNTLRPIVQRLAQTSEGERSMDATHVDVNARASTTQLYRWFIVIGDIQILNPELLSPQETRVIDEIGKRFDDNGTASHHVVTGV